MGCVSKMSVLKVLRVVGEVSGFSGTVGFWSQMALCTFRNFLEVDHSQSPQLIVTTSRSSRSSLHRHRDRVSRRVVIQISYSVPTHGPEGPIPISLSFTCPSCPPSSPPSSPPPSSRLPPSTPTSP